MSANQIEMGEIQAVWSAAGERILKFTVEMFHKGLRAESFEGSHHLSNE
jgi:hypothetical protein